MLNGLFMGFREKKDDRLTVPARSVVVVFHFTYQAIEIYTIFYKRPEKKVTDWTDGAVCIFGFF